MTNLREYIRESNAIEAVHEESAIEETLEAWEYLQDIEDLSHKSVQRTHELIMRNREPDIAGVYRDHQAYILGGQRPTHPVAIESEMETLLAWEPADPLAAIEWHVAFEQIHPFGDGNGRTGRLLYFWHCQQLDADPVVWRAEDREGYYDLFEATVDPGARIADEESNGG